MKEELRNLVSEEEQILYEGKPDKKCFIFESIFNPLLPFALVWAIIDFGVLGFTLFADSEKEFLFFIIPFMTLHLMPVWLYLGGVILSFKRQKNTNYIVTDRGIYVSSGVISKVYNHKPFAELSHIDLHRGMFDQWFNVGDIIATSAQRGVEGVSAPIVISSIADYENVYKMIKKLQTDIYTDVMYPNDKRPKENHGYHTEYKG